jgi:large exoprotein involved in heme utilization and adhesion
MGAATLGAASGGNLVVTASESVRLVGVDSQKQFYSGLFAVTSGTGDAGNLEIHTEQLTIEDGATISASTIGTGNAGKLTVRAAQVNLNGTSADSKLSSGLFAQVLPGATGKGGNLTIETEQLHVQGGARVATSTFGDGDAGDLTVRASTIDLMGTSADGNLASGLFAEAHQGAKGNTGKLMIQSERLSIKSGAKTSPTTLLECESVEVD